MVLELGLVGLAAWGAGLVLLGSMALALVRLIRGPSLADRVVALDLVSLLAVGFSGVTAIATGHSALLDVGISLALVAFLATLAFAWYLEHRKSVMDSPSSPRSREPHKDSNEVLSEEA